MSIIKLCSWCYGGMILFAKFRLSQCHNKTMTHSTMSNDCGEIQLNKPRDYIWDVFIDTMYNKMNICDTRIYSESDWVSHSYNILFIQEQDYEAMAFVGLKDIIKVPEARLSKLYGRNYPTYLAAINNVCCP